MTTHNHGMWHWLCMVPMVVIAIIGVSKWWSSDNSPSQQTAAPSIVASTNTATTNTASASAATLTSASSNGGIEMADQGRQHIAPSAEHPAYNSTPASSGWHYAAEAQWKEYTEPVVYELQVHNLEHGGVILHYRQDRITDAEKEQVQSLYQSLKKEYKKVILVPDTQMSTAYAITAWSWIDAFDAYDEGRIRAFVKEHYNDAPESSVE